VSNFNSILKFFLAFLLSSAVCDGESPLMDLAVLLLLEDGGWVKGDGKEDLEQGNSKGKASGARVAAAW
jgi:hypothetical protein